MAVNLGFLDRSLYYFFQIPPELSLRGWVQAVSEPLLLRKSDHAGNRTRNIWICSQEHWPLYHRGGPTPSFFILLMFLLLYIYIYISFLLILFVLQTDEVCQHKTQKVCCGRKVKLHTPLTSALDWGKLKLEGSPLHPLISLDFWTSPMETTLQSRGYFGLTTGWNSRSEPLK
jgi:hypothetical protein